MAPKLQERQKSRFLLTQRCSAGGASCWERAEEDVLGCSRHGCLRVLSLDLPDMQRGRSRRGTSPPPGFRTHSVSTTSNLESVTYSFRTKRYFRGIWGRNLPRFIILSSHGGAVVPQAQEEAVLFS